MFFGIKMNSYNERPLTRGFFYIFILENNCPMTHSKSKTVCLLLTVLLCCCKGKEKNTELYKTDSLFKNTNQSLKKPGSSFTDTMVIQGAAAIFYYPDTLQETKIKAITTPNIYNSTVHEMFYQMRNSKIVIKKSYPHLKIVDLTNFRFILFKKKDGSQQIVDLDNYNDARGLIMTNGINNPQLADMTNIDTELFRYFKD